MSSKVLSLLFVNQFYHPDVAATGQHLTDLAEFLAVHGHRVTVFAATAAYAERSAGRVPGPEASTGAQGRHGVRIRRFRSTAFGRATHVGRMVDYMSFYGQVLLAIVLGPRYDGVVFLTTPPLLPLVGVFARALRGQRYGVWSMDLHPAAEEAVGMIRSDSATARFLRYVWRIAHRRAEFVIALGSFMRDRIVADGVPSSRVTTVPPWSPRLDVANDDAGRLRRRLELEGRFVVMYSGNAGFVHDFDAILQAMRMLKDDDRIFFLFAGGGPRRADIEAFAQRERLRNFAYRDYFERDDLASALAVADVHLMSLRRIFAGISVPSKLYGIMAARRATLFIGPRACESANAIIEGDCGAVVDPADPNAATLVTRTILQWLANPAERARLGANAERAFVRDFEMTTNCGSIARLLEERWTGS